MTVIHNGCGKVRYESRGAAQRAIGVVKEKGRRRVTGDAPKAYPCPHCGGWHWGHEWKRPHLKDRG